MSAPAMLKAWDPFTLALEQNDYVTAQQTRTNLVLVSRDLVHFYEGNQLSYVLNYIAGLVNDPDLCARYQLLATYHNITRLLVDRVATLGQIPVRIIWKRKDGTPHKEAQALWNRVSSNLAGEQDWDAVVAANDQRKELCKTSVVSVTWDDRDRAIDLDVFTPNVIDVGYAEGNLRRKRPDKWYLLKEPATGLCQVWDFSSEASGPSGRLYTSDRSGADKADVEPVEVIDPATGRSLSPFVAFRTTLPTTDFFVWDGQAELKAAQEFVNRCYTQLSHTLHWGAYQIPILSGGNWRGENGEAPRLKLDASEAVIEPWDALGDGKGGPKIRWDGPANAAIIDSILKVVGEWVTATAATFHLSPDSVRANGEAMSGYALNIQGAALRIKNSRTRTLSRRPLARVVEKMRITWDTFNEKEKFPEDATFEVFIPDYSTGITTRDEMDAEVLAVENGFVPRTHAIMKYSPGMTPNEADELEAKWMAQSATAKDAAGKLNPPPVQFSGADKSSNTTDSVNTTNSVDINPDAKPVAPASAITSSVLNGARGAGRH